MRSTITQPLAPDAARPRASEIDLMDLDADLAQAAARHGARLTIATDSHRVEELEQLRYGVDIARRAWLTADDVATTRDADGLLELIGGGIRAAR